MPRSYLVVFNIAKKRNLGGLIRTADALGAHRVVIVGRKRFRPIGSFGTLCHDRLLHFYSLDEAVASLRERGCEIVGIEISNEAVAVDDDPFRGDTAFLVGNEGDGLSAQQIGLCDRVVYIKQFGRGASLNVQIAAGIVLHRFATWAGFPENPRSGQKFIPPSSLDSYDS